MTVDPVASFVTIELATVTQTMDEALPRDVMREVMAVAPLCAFNALARSCEWLRAMAASIAVSYADSMLVVSRVERRYADAAIPKLPNGVRHGVSTVLVGNTTIKATYDRGRIVGVCDISRDFHGCESFRPGGFIRYGERSCTAYGTRCHVILARKKRGRHVMRICMRDGVTPDQIITDGINPPTWTRDTADHHAIEAWFAQYTVDAPSHYALLRSLCLWNRRRIAFLRAHMPDLFDD